LSGAFFGVHFAKMKTSDIDPQIMFTYFHSYQNGAGRSVNAANLKVTPYFVAVP
jgi:hypothetical protein